MSKILPDIVDIAIQPSSHSDDEVLSNISTVEQIQEMKQKSVSGAISYMLRTLLLNGVGVGASAILALLLSVKEFGIYGIVTQIIGILTFFSDIGLAAALVQKKTEPSVHELRTVFTIQQILSWIIFLATLLIGWSGVLTPKIGADGILVLLALGISFPLASLKTIPSIKLERKLDFSKIVIPQIFEQLVYSGVLIGSAIMGYGVRSYVFAVLARSIIGVIVMFWLQRWPIGLCLDIPAARALLGTGAKFQLNDFLARIKDQLFYLILGIFLPLNEFGYISFAKNWSQLPYQLTVQNIIAITFPTYSRLQHDKALLKKAIDKTIFFISLSIFPMLVGMSVYIVPFVQLVPKYHKWQPAILAFVLFTLEIGWSAISTPLTNTLSAIGKINTSLKLMVMWTILTWVLTPVGIWFFGYQGVALAAFVIAFSSVIPIYYVKKIVPIEVWGNVWRQALAATVMGVVGLLLLSLGSQSWLGFFALISCSSLAYVVTFFAVGWKKFLFEIRSLRKHTQILE